MNADVTNSLTAAGLFVGGLSLAWWQAQKPARARRRGIRRLEQYANHPANRSPRKEDR